MACDTYLLGRTTYQMLAPHWSALKNNEMGIADKLNSVQKVVVSSTLEKAEWNNSIIISKNVPEEIAKLKEQPGGNIVRGPTWLRPLGREAYARPGVNQSIR